VTSEQIYLPVDERMLLDQTGHPGHPLELSRVNIASNLFGFRPSPKGYGKSKSSVVE
jgi:hypothetical protein